MKILNIQRMSTEDGPGIRTTLFVKGCPLFCKWCHNPESISPSSHTEWISVRCMGCNTCIQVCPKHALSSTENGIEIDQERCIACGKCAEECPTGAIEVKGINRSIDSLYKELIKDKSYWGKDGGVTLSGGEITMQSADSLLLAKKLHENNIRVAIDTCGFCKWETLKKLVDYTDIFLYDLKIFDPKKHLEFTGQDNLVIFENFELLAKECKEKKKTLWVRTPIIPGATDSDENISSLAKIIGDKADLWELCAFNNLCKDKYDRLKKDWDYCSSPLMEAARMKELVKIAIDNGGKNVIWSGMTKREE